MSNPAFKYCPGNEWSSAVSAGRRASAAACDYERLWLLKIVFEHIYDVVRQPLAAR
jgi:hypothetical protein